MYLNDHQNFVSYALTKQKVIVHGKDTFVMASLLKQIFIKKIPTASSGNRTRAARVAGEHSTTEPTMLRY